SDHKILIVQDCAHSFGATFHEKNVCNEGDTAIYGLEIGKYISSVFGGMLTTNDDDIYERVKHYRDEHFTKPSPVKQFSKLLYLMATYVAFNNTFYGFVNFLEENTPFLNKFTKYYRESRIDFPEDFNIRSKGR
ncbi:DegT/DnrJ/EryC1/StrS family aminotransferase, partial [Chloroflexota bacterium]